MTGSTRSGVRNVDRDDASARRVAIGLQEEARPLVAGDVVDRMPVGDESANRCAADRKVLIKDAIVRVAARIRGDDEVASVLGYLAVECPVGVVGPAIHEHVGALRGSEPMEEDFLVERERLERFTACRPVVGGIVESGAVLRPRCAGESAPLDAVGQIAAARNVAHVPRLPVRPGDLRCVCEPSAIARERRRPDGRRSVVRKRVWVEQHVRRSVQPA